MKVNCASFLSRCVRELTFHFGACTEREELFRLRRAVLPRAKRVATNANALLRLKVCAARANRMHVRKFLLIPFSVVFHVSFLHRHSSRSCAAACTMTAGQWALSDPAL